VAFPVSSVASIAGLLKPVAFRCWTGWRGTLTGA
jgi:hypothetical protein